MITMHEVNKQEDVEVIEIIEDCQEHIVAMVEIMRNYNMNHITEDDKGPRYTYGLDTKYTNNDEKVDEDQDIASVADDGLRSA